MARDVLHVLRALLSKDTGEQVHFHTGPDGRPAVCEFPRCDRPGLAVD